MWKIPFYILIKDAEGEPVDGEKKRNKTDGDNRGEAPGKKYGKAIFGKWRRLALS